MSFLKHSGSKALGFAALAAIALGACSGGSANDDLPLLRATLTIKTVSQGGVCDSVPVRMSPKELIGEANKYANSKLMVAEVNTTGPTDENGAPMCNGTGETLPMAPGKWEFSAPLASGSATCVRDKHGNFVMTRTVVTDISELRRAQDETVKAVADLSPDSRYSASCC